MVGTITLQTWRTHACGAPPPRVDIVSPVRTAVGISHHR